MGQSSSSHKFTREELSDAVGDYLVRNPEAKERLRSMGEQELKNRSDGTPFYEIFTDIRGSDGQGKEGNIDSPYHLNNPIGEPQRGVRTGRNVAQEPPRLTDDPDIDLAARYIYAEGSKNEAEMRAICQTFVNRYNADRQEFGGQNAARVWQRLSIADDNRGSKSFREAANDESLSRLPPADQDRYRTAAAAAKYVLKENPNRDQKGGGILPGDDYYYFLGHGAQTPGHKIGATTFYNCFPQGKDCPPQENGQEKGRPR